jgi:L-aspartate oxidase
MCQHNIPLAGSREMQRRKADILIIGSGIAGCTAAISAAASGKHILLITKTADPMESNTRYAQGGIATLGDDDSKELFFKDIMAAGNGITNPDAVKLVVGEGPRLVKEFLINEVGVMFQQNESQSYDFTREAAHSTKRILHYYDTTGQEIEDKLLKKIKNSPNISMLTDHTAIDLITSHHNSSNPLARYGRNFCLGAYVLDNTRGVVLTFLADATILATGGIGRLYQNTTNPDCATGDGICMAYRAGAEVTNMEYTQFHPTMLFTEEGSGFLISESVRGEGGRLLNVKGEQFMKNYSPEWQDLAPRDEVSRAIYNEMARTESRHVFLDIAHFNKKGIKLRERFPGISEECAKHKIDITNEPIPVVPAAHYFCGGVLIDDWGETTLTGLYAVGETACSGVHGANRLASVSLLEGLTYGYRAGARASKAEPREEYFKDISEWMPPKIVEERNNDPLLIMQDWNNLRSTMWNYVGIIRTARRLVRAVSDLRNLRTRISDYYRNTTVSKDKVELRNGITVANVIAEFARRNDRQIGSHYVREEL